MVNWASSGSPGALLRQGPARVPPSQGELFAVYRYHTAFTYSTLRLIEAEALRRHLVAIPARLARSARGQTLHLPEGWPSVAAPPYCAKPSVPRPTPRSRPQLPELRGQL